MRATIRGLILCGHLGSGFLQALYLSIRYGKTWHEMPSAQVIIQRWMQRLTRILALRIEVPEKPLPVPAMIVANHISWLDIIAIASVRPAQFLAKDNVRQWPLIGSLAARCGTQFIQRNSASALRECNKRLCHSLRIRRHVVIFPEGTTSEGTDVGAFHPALFEAARQAYCPIQPLAIRYRHNGERDTVAPYTGNDIFILHLWRILGRRETRVELQFLPPISSRANRRQLAQQSRTQIISARNRQDDIRAPMPALHPLPCHLLKPAPAREQALAQKSA